MLRGMRSSDYQGRGRRTRDTAGAPSGSGRTGAALGDFLRARRAAADPRRFGYADDGRQRRVPGLRREELAELAHVSVDYIVRIEQGRKRRVSREVLTALADALGLGADERQYLFAVADVAPVPSRRPTAGEDRVPANVRQLLDGLTAMPALVVNRRLDVLAWNRTAAALLTDFGALPDGRRNLASLIFLDAAYQALFGDAWEPVARESVAVLRMEAGRRPDDMKLQALVGELGVQDPRFRAWWAGQSVSGPKLRRKTYHHPLAGPVTLEAEVLAVESRPGLSLVVYTAPAGSPSQEALRFLVQWTTDTAGTDDP